MCQTRPLSCLLLAAGVLGHCHEAARAEDPTRRLEVMFVAGQGAGTRISNNAWQGSRRNTFQGQRVRFFDNARDLPQFIINRPRMTTILQQADILFYSGHTVTPRPPVMTHALKLQSSGDDNGAMTAADIRAALQGRRGPRLVVLNGCRTTNLGDGVVSQNRLNTAFGITQGTQGRAFLGWTEEVVGFNADDQMTRLLTHWTTASADGAYPTLEESLRTLGNPTITLIGDGTLRYNIPFLLRSANPKQNSGPPLRLFWRLNGENTAQAIIDFGAAHERELQTLGLPRKMTMAATRTAAGFKVRDPQFQRLVQKICDKLAITVAGIFPTGERPTTPTVQVHEATLKVRGDGDNLRVSIKIRASATRAGQGAGRQELINGTYEFIATPESPSRPRPPA